MEDNMNQKDKETNSPAETPHAPSSSQPSHGGHGDMHLPLKESSVAGNRAKALLVLVVIVLVAVGATYLITKSTTKTTPPKNSLVALAPAKVSITSKGFSPATITVKVNQAVVWTNKDSANHEVNSDAYPTDNELPSFNDKQPIATNSTYAYVFNQAGTYSYHDDLNPFTFKGTVVVKK